MFQDKILKSVADAVKDVMAEQLKGDQHKIDKNKNGKVDAHDFKLLRKEEAPKKPASPFDLKNYKSQIPTKPGEKAGFDSKKISTGTVYTRKPVKEESTQDEFNAEIKKAKDKSIGKIKADVAKPAVQAVRNEDVEHLEEKNVPTSPEKWSQAKAQAKAKFDVYPSAYANGWAAKKYKEMGGGWKSVSEQAEQIDEGIFDSLKRGYTTGLQTGLKKKIKPEHHSSYDIAGVKSTSDATSILQKAKQAGHHINEEVEQIDELSKTTLGSYVKKASHDVAHKGAMTRQFANDSAAAKKDSDYFGAKKADDKSNKMFAKSWKRRENMGKAVDRLTKEEVEINERSLTASEAEKKEDMVKGMKKNLAGFKERYGKDAKSVMYATATKNAKKD